MEARIIKGDMTLGKRIYKVDVPADIDKLGARLKKNMIGVRRWKNINDSFAYIYCFDNLYGVFFSEKAVLEILYWMLRLKKED